MKVTKSKLKQIIKEEIQSILERELSSAGKSAAMTRAIQQDKARDAYKEEIIKDAEASVEGLPPAIAARRVKEMERKFNITCGGRWVDWKNDQEELRAYAEKHGSTYSISTNWPACKDTSLSDWALYVALRKRAAGMLEMTRRTYTEGQTLTKSRLKQIIQEEITKTLKEDDWSATDERERAARKSGAKQELLRQAREDFEAEMDNDAEWFGWDDVQGEVGEPIEVLRAKISEWAAKNGAFETSKKYSN
jgi:hypothetical protein